MVLRENPTSVRLPEDMKRELDDAAKERSESAHWLIIFIIRDWLNKWKRKKAKAT